MKTKTISLRHVVNGGDIIAAMAGMKSLYDKYNSKSIIYQQLNVRGDYYQGATHPLTDANGNMVCMNEDMFNLLKPLIESQEYIEVFKQWRGEKVHVDLDIIRNGLYSGMPNMMIQSWIMMAFPDMDFDLSQQWMFVDSDDTYKDKVIVNFTERYRNNKISYYFFKEYEDKLIFAGTTKEYLLFCNAWELDIPRLEITDFLQYAKFIKGCKFFLGNQSAAVNIAFALQHPRIVELCPFAQNYQPFVGKDNYGFYHQGALEYYFKKLITR